MRVDHHVHSTYSDGRFLPWMCRAAAKAGLDAVGIADHCNVSPRESQQRAKKTLGFNLDLTYERRRDAIAHVREELDIRIYDAVEMDFEPRDREEIAAFLETAGFEYAIGSVHELEGTNVHVESYFAPKPETERRELVDRYYEKVVALLESDLFDIAAHIDLVERNPALRGLAGPDQYERVAAAAADSRTVLEVNAGRVLADYGEFHPHPDLLAVLRESDQSFVLGSDAHTPGEIEPRTRELEAFVDEQDLEIVEPPVGAP